MGDVKIDCSPGESEQALENTKTGQAYRYFGKAAGNLTLFGSSRWV